MGKNIALLYMSAYFAQPAPEGSKNRFLRTQTNEAAVSALWKDPASRPDKIVALCSDTVRTKPTVPAADGSGNKVPTLEYFRDEFLKQLGVQPEQLVAVSVPDSMEEADQTRAISAVLEQVAENDNLYIDLSGGMRDTATLLLIVARYLKDIRMVQTKKVLYSELKGNSSVVRDSTGLYNLMDLITAVDAFFSTGTTEKLKAYLFHEARPFTVNLCLTKDKTEANGNALFRVATLTEAQEYLTAAVEQGELLLDLTRKDTVAQGIVYYQSVQQYRNQINHATDSAVKFQKDTGLLPLSTSAIEQTLGDVAFYLFKLKECKATAPVGIELLDSNKAF